MLRRTPLAETALARALAQIDATDGTVLVGPWHSEVGFEVLYWIPFLRRLVEDGRLDPERLVAVSRGGVSEWYRGVCAGYVELFDAVEPEEYRRRGGERRREAGGQKQGSVSAWDRWLLERAGWEPGRLVLHPATMYSALSRFWKGGQPLNDVIDRTRFSRWPEPPTDGLELPDSFVAAKFYFSDAFPDTAENRSFAASALRAVAEQSPVVLLLAGSRLDEHEELFVADGVTVLAGGVLPAGRNLGLQGAAVSRARAFVGTYGGFSYLATAYGVPGLSFASRPDQFFPAHLDVARRAASAIGTPFSLLDTTALAGLVGLGEAV